MSRLPNHPFLLLALVGLAVRPCVADDTMRDRFLRDAPQGWRQLQLREQQFVGSGRLEDIYRRDGKVVQHLVSEWQIKRNGDWILFEFPLDDRLKGTVRTSAWGSNDSYGFRVSRASTGEWAIAEAANDRATLESAYTTACSGGFLRGLHYSWAIDGIFPLDQVIADPSFKIESLVEDTKLVRLVFTADINSPNPKLRRRLSRAKVLLDSSLSWAIRESEAEMQPDTFQKYVVDYHAVGWPSKLTVTENSEEGRLLHNVSITFEEPTFVEVPEGEFKLTALGLPEPAWLQNPPQGARWWLWGSLLGGALLVLGIGLSWLRKRATS